MKAIILAGGLGSRLWPLSRQMQPKQTLALDSCESILQQTFLRLNSFINASNIVTVTNIQYYNDIKMQLDTIDRNNMTIAEPIGKNTAPAIICALKYLKQKCIFGFSDDIVLITPSDHLIKNEKEFIKSVKNAEMLAKQGYIVTFGIKPEYPETGYGYIKVNKKIKNGFKVDRFVEKPDFETAKKFINENIYYWNSGIFAAKISVLLDEYKKYMPKIYEEIKNLDYTQCKNKIPYFIYNKMPSISIDYAIMEKSKKIVLVEMNADWNDLGSWQQLYKTKSKDENGNVIEGSAVINNVKNSFIYSQKETIAVSDMENIIIAATEDAVMLCNMNNSQNVKILYDKLAKKNSDTIKIHKTVFRPWGYYTCLNEGKGYLTKTICLLPKQKLTLQSHNYRSEHWVILEGKALVIKDDKEYIINEGESVDIPVKVKHSLQNPYDKELKIIEIQKGNYISDEDIIRYEDIYGEG